MFVGTLFFLAGGAMAVYAAMYLWSDVYLTIASLELLETEPLQIGMFVVGCSIAGVAVLGIMSACCSRCAANPDGVCDGCEKCFTAVCNVVYLIVLSVLAIATLIIAGFLSYYAVILDRGSTDECPYPNSNASFVAANVPDPWTCPIDAVIHDAFFAVVRR